MTIECTSCHARYTIADSLVPPQGARVRCRKCGEVIQVKPSAPMVSPSELPLVPPSPESFRPESPNLESPRPESASALFPAASEPPAPAPEPPPPAREQPAPAGEAAGHGFERFPTQGKTSEAPAGAEYERFATASFSPTVEAEPAPPAPPAPAPVAPTPAEPAFQEPAPEAPLAPPPLFQVPSRAPDPAPPFPPASAPAPPFPPATAPPRAAPAPAAPAPAASRPRITASTIPDGLTPEQMQRHEKARRLARVLASDIAIYNREKRERGIREGNLVAVLGYEIKKSWETYKERVGADFANSTPYFRDALNEIVAEGQKIF